MTQTQDFAESMQLISGQMIACRSDGLKIRSTEADSERAKHPDELRKATRSELTIGNERGIVSSFY